MEYFIKNEAVRSNIITEFLHTTKAQVGKNSCMSMGNARLIRNLAGPFSAIDAAFATSSAIDEMEHN